MRQGEGQVAWQAAIRQKYGRYPLTKGIPFMGFVLPIAIPLEGEEETQIPALPEQPSTIVNRAHERQQMKRGLTRQLRKANWTSSRKSVQNVAMLDKIKAKKRAQEAANADESAT